MESRRPERLRAWSEAAEAALMTPASFASASRVDGEDARFLQCSLADEARRRSSERRRASRWDVTGMPSGARLEQSAMQSSAVGGRQSSCSPLRRAPVGEVIQLGEAPSVGPLPTRSRGSAESRLDGGPAGALATVPDRRQLRDVEVSRLSSTVQDQLPDESFDRGTPRARRSGSAERFRQEFPSTPVRRHWSVDAGALYDRHGDRGESSPDMRYPSRQVRARFRSPSAETPRRRRYVTEVTATSPIYESPMKVSRAATIKLPSFDGTSSSLETFLSKLDNRCQYYRWTPTEKLCHLRACLEGNASDVLSELPSRVTFDELVAVLKNRFSEAQQSENFRVELEARKRAKNESLKSVYQDICRLFALAFPREKSELAKLLARDYFLKSLQSEQYRLHVLERGATSIEQACDMVSRLEAIMHGSNAVDYDDCNRRKVRAVGHHSDETPSADRAVDSQLGQLSKVVTELQEGLRTLLLQQQVMQQQLAAVSGQIPGHAVRQRSLPAARTEAAAAETVTRVESSAGNARSGKKQRLCFKCHSPLHIQKDCPQLKRAVNDSAAPIHGVKRTQGGNNDMTRAYLPATIKQNGKISHITVCLNNGSCENLCPSDLVQDIRPSDDKLFAANGTEIKLHGRGVLHFRSHGVPFSAEVICCDVLDQVLLGLPWLTSNCVDWNFAKAEVVINGRLFHLKPSRDNAHVRRIYAAEDTLVPKQAMIDVPVNLKRSQKVAAPCNLLLESKQFGDGLFVPDLLFGDAEEGHVRIFNSSHRDVLIRKNMYVGTAEPMEFNCTRCGPVCYCYCEPNNDDVSDANPNAGKQVRVVHRANEEFKPMPAEGERVIEDDNELILPFLNSLPDDFSDGQRARVKELLLQFTDIMARFEYDVGRVPGFECKLELKDPSLPPIREPLRRHAFAYAQTLRAQTDKLLRAGLIKPSNSPWASNVVLVSKKPEKRGEAPEIRMALDFRSLNLRLKSPNFPMGSTSSIIQNLQGGEFFQCLDLKNAFLSVKLAEESQELVSFVVPHGQFSFTSLCAGLNLAPAVYSQLGSEILGDMRFTEVWNWIDDFTGVCKSFEHGLDLLRRIFERFRAYNVRLNPNKCKIFQSEARVLGVLVSRDGVREDPMRAEKMLHWAFPSTTKQMRKLVGWLQFGKDFYENVSHVIRPLTDCLKKGAKVVQNEQTLAAFEKVKQLVSEAPPLALFDPQAIQVLESDASNVGIGVCLKNKYPNGEERVIAFCQGFETQIAECILLLMLMVFR
jgi:hypothetical protein